MKPRVSIVMPFYNEEANAQRVVAELLSAVAESEWDIDIVCVQNGSCDATPQVLTGIASVDSKVSVVEVKTNQGYGYGIRRGLAAANGEIVGYLDGDGQVPAVDVLRVLAAVRGHRAAKAVRVSRGDGWERRLVSTIYNLLFKLLFPAVQTDANAKPKFLHKEDLAKLDLVSNDWFIDAEVMIKTAALGIRWAETAVEFRKRAGGSSHVRFGSIVEFVNNLCRWRFGDVHKQWKKKTLQS